jgi:hypothetical protein
MFRHVNYAFVATLMTWLHHEQSVAVEWQVIPALSAHNFALRMDLNMKNRICDLRYPSMPRAFGEQHSIECRQVLRTSAAQRALWFAQKLNPSSRSHKLAEYLEIRGSVDETVFEVALRQVVEEAENLHAVFIDNGGAPLQICDLPMGWCFPILDFSASADPTVEANLWMQADMMRPVPLDRGPLFSFALLKIAADRYFFYQCAHHIVIDAFSGALFTQRLAEVYSALVANIIPPPCPFDKLRYLIEVDSTYEASDAFQRDREYWMTHLADMPLPVSLAWHRGSTSTGTISQRRRLSEQTNTALRELAQKCGATLPQLLVALISIYLHRITGQTDLVIGFAVTARTNRSTRKTPGMVANVVPLRLVLTPDLPLSEILTQVKKNVAARFNAWHHRLDVRRAPLMAAKIAEDASHGRWVALLLLHHLVEDATSVRTLMEEIAAHLLGEAARLPAPVSYRNYVAQSRLGTSRERDEAFFREMLGSVDEPTLPYGLSDVQGGSGIVDAVLPVEAGLAGRLRARARHLGVSAASLFHLAWGHVLGRLSNREDVVFGTVLLGRMQGASDRSLGMFINTLPLRLELAENTVADAVRQTQARLAGLLLHEHASLAWRSAAAGFRPPSPCSTHS